MYDDNIYDNLDPILDDLDLESNSESDCRDPYVPSTASLTAKMEMGRGKRARGETQTLVKVNNSKRIRNLRSKRVVESGDEDVEDAGVVRKEVGFRCGCGGHLGLADCEAEKLVRTRVGDVMSLILESKEVVTLVIARKSHVTEDPLHRQRQEFLIHKELLVMHSGHFKSLLNKKKPLFQFKREWEDQPAKYFNESDAVVECDFDEPTLATFVSWLYTGSISGSGNDNRAEWYDLWAAGSVLDAPGYQNYIMSVIRKLESLHKDIQSTAWNVKKIYSLEVGMGIARGEGGKINLLRDFALACVASNNLFERFAPGSKERGEWVRVFGEVQILGMEVLMLGGGKRWGAKGPWHEDFGSEWEREDATVVKEPEDGRGATTSNRDTREDE